MQVNYTCYFTYAKKPYFILNTEFDIPKFKDVSQIKRTAAHFALNSLTALEVSSEGTYGEPLLLGRFVVSSYSNIILFVTNSDIELKSKLDRYRLTYVNIEYKDGLILISLAEQLAHLKFV